MIQIADFIAFSVNRMQMIAVKENKSKVDIAFLEIMSNLDYQNIIGVTKKLFKELNSAEYDNLIRLDKDNKKIISDADYEEIKRLKNEFENF